MWWVHFGMAVLLAAVAFATAPLVGRAFGHAIVGTLVSAYTLKLVAQTVQFVPEATLRRELAFDTTSKLKLVATVAETGAKLAVAYIGAHGHPDLRIWCFVAAPFASTAVMMVGTQLVRPWRPAFAFDAHAAREAVRFGSQLSLADLLYFAYSNADYLVIGAVFDATAVGIYRLAYELVLDVVRLVSMVTAEVAFPAFARLADDRAAIGEQLVALTRQNLAMVAPLLVVIGVAAGDLLAILYPPLGPAATTASQTLCIVGALRSISFVLPAMLAGLGHSRDVLVYNIVAAIVCPTAFAVAAIGWPSAGYLAVAWGWAASYPLAFGVLVYFALARTGVRARDYLRGLAPLVLWGLATAAVALAVHAVLPESKWVRAIAVAAIAAASYGAYWKARQPRASVNTMNV